MECRLQYLEAEIEEAHAALARERAQLEEVGARADRAEADLEACGLERDAERDAARADADAERAHGRCSRVPRVRLAPRAR